MIVLLVTSMRTLSVSFGILLDDSLILFFFSFEHETLNTQFSANVVAVDAETVK